MAQNKGYLKSNRKSSGDDQYTPFYAVTPLIKYLKNSNYRTIWCPFDEKWSAYVQTFREEGFNVIHSSLSDGKDFFQYEPKEPYDIIISNPPFSKKDKILFRLDKLNKPFALLLPLNSLQGKRRFNIFCKGIQLLSFDDRIGFHKNDYEKPVGSNCFASAYFCRKFLPNDLIIEHLNKYDRKLKENENDSQKID